MSCVTIHSDEEAKAKLARHRQIEQMLKADQKKMSQEAKILLLGMMLTIFSWFNCTRTGVANILGFKGPGESGKSTILKQMKLIYAAGFSKTEREEYRRLIFSNIFDAFKSMFEAMDRFGLQFKNRRNEVGRLFRQRFPYSHDL